MNKLRNIKSHRVWSVLLLGLIALLRALLSRPRVALAHPHDEYLQATYITVAPTQIAVELNLTPGLLTPQVLTQIDADGNQQISAAEGQAYVDAVLRNVALHVDGKPLALEVTKFDMPPYLTIQAGYGTIRIFTIARLPDDMTGTHQITYTNNNATTSAAYQVNTFVEKGVAITLGKQNRDSSQQSMTVDYTIGSAGPTS